MNHKYRRIRLSDTLTTLVDADNYERLNQRRWHCNHKGYAVCFESDPIEYMHRVIMRPGPDEQVDHMNGDKLDNRRANLCLASNAENSRRRKMPKTNTTGYKGVSKKRNGRYTARICYDGHQFFLGSYPTKEKAALAYNVAAEHLFRDYAYLNDVDGELDHETLYWIIDKLNGNARPRPKPKRPTVPKRRSPFRGVYWERGKWRAKIGIKNDKVHLGYFMDEVEAAKAYDEAARRLKGDNAVLNFPAGR